MNRSKKTTTTVKGGTTTTVTQKTASAGTPCVGKVYGNEQGLWLVWLEAGVKGVRTGSILMLRQKGAGGDVVQIGRVTGITNRQYNGNPFKVAVVQLLGAWFSSYTPPGFVGSGVMAYGNVYIEQSFYQQAASGGIPNKGVIESLMYNKFPTHSPEGAFAYWMVDKAREMWEQRIEIPRDIGKTKLFM